MIQDWQKSTVSKLHLTIDCRVAHRTGLKRQPVESDSSAKRHNPRTAVLAVSTDAMELSTN